MRLQGQASGAQFWHCKRKIHESKLIVPLTPEQQAIADLKMEVRILRAVGQAYEDLFVEVMTLHDAEFRPVKPQGPIGDKKNDGFCGSSGKYFQVYAPEELSESVTDALKKLETDFAGLLAYWNSLSAVKTFRYVLNDRFRGTYPTIEAALLKLKTAHALQECEPFLNKDLMRIVAQLDDRSLMRLVGHLPSAESINDLDYLVFTDVLEHVNRNGAAVTPEALLRVPDFSEKLRLNRINPHVAALLTAGNMQSGAVEGFFNSHAGFSKMAIRDKLAQMYATAKAAVDGAHSNRGDLIFWLLLEGITPSENGKAAQDAAIVLLAYFFETCDVYEDPALL